MREEWRRRERWRERDNTDIRRGEKEEEELGEKVVGKRLLVKREMLLFFVFIKEEILTRIKMNEILIN